MSRTLGLLCLAVVAALVSTTAGLLAGPDVEVIDLGYDREIRATVLKETADEVFVDLGYTVLGIPKKSIVRRRTFAPEGEASPAAEAAVEGRLHRSLDRPEASVKENVDRVSAAVVLITSPSGQGSGFILNPHGYLITNDHVVQGETKISVTLFEDEDGGLRKRKFDDVRIVATNAYTDLALLKIDSETPLPYVPLAADDACRTGEPVFAVGNPLGLERSVSEGILSTLNRPFDGLTYLQTTTQINPGNSGGPLFNLKGQVIGVTNMGYLFSEGLGFAIPVDRVRWFLANRQAFAYDKDNPNTGHRYLPAPRKPGHEPAGEKAEE